MTDWEKRALEAEETITRLRQEQMVVTADGEQLMDALRRTEAAEAELTENLRLSREAHWATVAELARLREGLEQIANAAGMEHYVHDRARALLAEDGAAQPDDTPFTAPAVQSHERGLFERRKDGAA